MLDSATWEVGFRRNKTAGLSDEKVELQYVRCCEYSPELWFLMVFYFSFECFHFLNVNKSSI